MTMRQSMLRASAGPLPSYPLLEASDLPGDDDWSLTPEIGFDDGDPDGDPLATLNLGLANDD
jgi:hypothetical protein